VSRRTPELRVRQGLALLAGGVLIVALLGTDPSDFYWTPLAVGLAYLAAASIGGKEGGYWATAVVLVGWGASVVLVREAQPDLDTAGLYLAGAGLGATTGMALRYARFDVDPLGAAVTVLAAGLILAFAAEWEPLEEARTYGVLVGVVGFANVLAGASQRARRRVGASAPPRRSEP
jgi:hypothetical protein